MKKNDLFFEKSIKIQLFIQNIFIFILIHFFSRYEVFN